MAIGALGTVIEHIHDDLEHIQGQVATSLAQCRNALVDAGHLWKTIEGAYIFVHPHQYRQAMAATHVLRPDNIIVSASISAFVRSIARK